MKSGEEKHLFLEGNVEIVGYGFPKPNFDSHNVTLLNRHNNNSADFVDHHLQTGSYQYIIDPDKMSPMRGIYYISQKHSYDSINIGMHIINNLISFLLS